MKYADETTHLNPPLQFVPWVVVNGQALMEVSCPKKTSEKNVKSLKFYLIFLNLILYLFCGFCRIMEISWLMYAKLTTVPNGKAA